MARLAEHVRPGAPFGHDHVRAAESGKAGGEARHELRGRGDADGRIPEFLRNVGPVRVDEDLPALPAPLFKEGGSGHVSRFLDPRPGGVERPLRVLFGPDIRSDEKHRLRVFQKLGPYGGKDVRRGASFELRQHVAYERPLRDSLR